MNNPFTLFVGTLFVGYLLSLYVSRPVEKNGEVRSNRLPTLRIRNLELLPNLRIHIGQRTYWLHHWLYLLIFTVVMFVSYENVSHMLAVKGAAIGGILQGLRYPDRFKFRHPRR